MKRKMCARCVNDATVKNIRFDEKGICNYCHAYDATFGVLHDYENLEKLFIDRLDAVKGKHAYDAAVGFSGGKDSAYVLYKTIKEYELKIKAFTLNNGFLSKKARDNIDAIVKQLGVEHEYVEYSEEILKKAYRHIVGKFLSPCIACSYLGYAAMINYASRIDAGICIHGRSFPQMFRGYLPDGLDSFVRYIDAGLKPADEVDLDALYGGAWNDMNLYLDKRLAEEIGEIFMPDARDKGFREFVAYFLYHKYDKSEILRFIQENMPWRADGENEHFDCTISNAATYIKNITARRAHIMPELSVFIREGAVSREEALEILKTSMIERPDEELNLMCGYMGLGKKRLLLKARIYGLRWW
jgi:asparagine synthetase B (glutamine-hydrolysing)